MKQIKTDEVIRWVLDDSARKIETRLCGQMIALRAPMQQGVDDLVRLAVESLAEREKKSDHLIVMLETTGGSIEVVERISDVLRHHYKEVSFVIPGFAYSAGTVLALSGDKIYMDYYSVLGPIDPQIRRSDGVWVPAIGYLEKYNTLIEKSKNGTISRAELEFLVKKFDPAELFFIEQAKAQSILLIEKWLCQYKFKDWKKTEDNNQIVTPEMKSRRAQEIAEKLGDPTIWKSHGRGIPMRTLESQEIKLKIEDFGSDEDLNREVRSYYNLLIDYCTKLGKKSFIHSTADLSYI